MPMKSEAWIAIYAAIVATSALLLNFRSWLEARPRLHRRLEPAALAELYKRQKSRKPLADDFDPSA